MIFTQLVELSKKAARFVEKNCLEEGSLKKDNFVVNSNNCEDATSEMLLKELGKLARGRSDWNLSYCSKNKCFAFSNAINRLTNRSAAIYFPYKDIKKGECIPCKILIAEGHNRLPSENSFNSIDSNCAHEKINIELFEGQAKSFHGAFINDIEGCFHISLIFNQELNITDYEKGIIKRFAGVCKLNLKEKAVKCGDMSEYQIPFSFDSKGPIFDGRIKEAPIVLGNSILGSVLFENKRRKICYDNQIEPNECLTIPDNGTQIDRFICSANDKDYKNAVSENAIAIQITLEKIREENLKNIVGPLKRAKKPKRHDFGVADNSMTQVLTQVFGAFCLTSYSTIYSISCVRNFHLGINSTIIENNTDSTENSFNASDSKTINAMSDDYIGSFAVVSIVFVATIFSALCLYGIVFFCKKTSPAIVKGAGDQKEHLLLLGESEEEIELCQVDALNAINREAFCQQQLDKFMENASF